MFTVAHPWVCGSFDGLHLTPIQVRQQKEESPVILYHSHLNNVQSSISYD